MSREVALRAYFKASSQKTRIYPGIVQLIIAALLLLVAMPMITDSGELSSGCAIVFGIPAALLALWGGGRLWLAWSRHRRLLLEASTVSDDDVQNLLDDGIARVKERSFDALCLSDEELKSDLLTIVAPVLWSTENIDEDNLRFRTGNDGCVRFGVYSIVIIALTERNMGVFRCEYDLVQDNVRNERTTDYQYRNIVSVSTSEETTSLRLLSGETLTAVQIFRVSVQNGEAVRITVDAPELRRMAGVDSLPASGAERAVRTIRAMLRQRSI